MMLLTNTTNYTYKEVTEGALLPTLRLNGGQERNAVERVTRPCH